MSVVKIKKEDFEAEVLHSDKPVLVDFFATWCGPCRMLAPIIDGIADRRDDIKVVKVDVDECPELAVAYGIDYIPALVVIRNGKVTAKSDKARTEAAVNALIDA